MDLDDLDNSSCSFFISLRPKPKDAKCSGEESIRPGDKKGMTRQPTHVLLRCKVFTPESDTFSAKHDGNLYGFHSCVTASFFLPLRGRIKSTLSLKARVKILLCRQNSDDSRAKEHFSKGKDAAKPKATRKKIVETRNIYKQILNTRKGVFFHAVCLVVKDTWLLLV